MSDLRSILGALTPLAVATSLLLGGCSTKLNTKLTCTDSCPSASTILHTEATDGMSPPDPVCCSVLCLIPATGCDSGYRYVTTMNDVGDCVPPMTDEVSCPAGPVMDLSVKVDQSQPDTDAGE